MSARYVAANSDCVNSLTEYLLRFQHSTTAPASQTFASLAVAREANHGEKLSLLHPFSQRRGARILRQCGLPATHAVGGARSSKCRSSRTSNDDERPIFGAALAPPRTVTSASVSSNTTPIRPLDPEAMVSTTSHTYRTSRLGPLPQLRLRQ